MADYVGYIVQGACMAIGAGVGNYLATAHITNRIKKFERIVNKRIKLLNNDTTNNKRGK